MKVKMLVSRSGPAGAVVPGDEIDVEDDEAKRMIAAGQCEPVKSAGGRRKATKKPPETTSKE